MYSKVLDTLTGHRLAAVVFVEDYLQFQFDGPGIRLSAYSLPTVMVHGRASRAGESDWRNDLCSLIGGAGTLGEVC